MKKVIFLLLMTFLLVPNVNAFYAWSHRYWDLKAITETNSFITQECGTPEMIALCLDSESSLDIPVLHYSDNKLSSYIFTHVQSAQTGLKQDAGADSKLRCQAYCSGMHLIADHYAHDENGLVPKYLANSFAPNLGGHMTIENDFDLKHKAYLKNVVKDSLVVDGTVDYYDSVYLDTFFQDEKHILLLNEIAGIDLRNDLNIISNGYKGTGFKAIVYDQKLKLPFWYWAVSIGGIILGLGLTLLIIFTGKTNWKWFMIIPWVLLIVLAVIVVIAYFTGSTYQIINGFLRIPTSVGLLSVSEKDVEYYDRVIVDALKRYLETGVIPFDDSSGLSYCPGGQTTQSGSCSHWRTGALTQSGKRFTYGVVPLLAIFFALMNVLLFIQTYSKKSSPKVTKIIYVTLGGFATIMLLIILLGKCVL